MNMEAMIDRGLLPDPILRLGVRKRCDNLIREYEGHTTEERQAHLNRIISELDGSPVAVDTSTANEQHYELPPEFFQTVLGPHLKYSSCYWDETTRSLEAAEEKMLALTCERAELADGQHILELGCGWGSLSLYMARRFPRAKITAVSYSKPQRQFIMSRAAERGLTNLTVLTMDMNELRLDRAFDRIVSVEMFEHLRNYRQFFSRLSRLLDDNGKLFIHIFAHRYWPFLYDHTEDDSWMARYFFTGGTMPSAHLFLYLAENLTAERHWQVQGTHYEKTLNAWLRRMDDRKREIMPVLQNVYGEQATAWWHRWRLFFLSCAEFFGYAGGNEWLVQHYLFARK